MTIRDEDAEVPFLSDMRVDGEAVQEIFRRFAAGQYLVNRRYQRKLVWTFEQKERLIDSIARGLPIPLILLAERGNSGGVSKSYEIIDGLQRLHAITSFISNDFSYDGNYFDLETLATTKARKDNPSDPLIQRTPVLDRETCVRIVNYQVPVSAYSAAKSSSIDEVFRRINSSGRQLSRQEVRQAGMTSGLAGLVRKLSAMVREDSTLSDILPLGEISSISIKGPQEDAPGIDIDQVFWVRERILRRDDLRGSLDEQSVLDLVLEMLDVNEPLSTQTRDAAYDDDSQLGRQVSSRLLKFGASSIVERFDSVMQVCLSLVRHLSVSGQSTSLMEFMGRPSGNPAGRYFHVFFMAIDACHNKGMHLSSIEELSDAVKGIWSGESINPGGSWTFEDRRRHIKKFQKLIADAFSRDPSLTASGRNDVQILERDLRNIELENERFELKGGLVSLEGPVKVSSALIDKILKIATAVANVGPDGQGRIYIGITDNPEDARKYQDKYGLAPFQCAGSENFNFDVIGIDHEVEALGESLDIYVGRITKCFRESVKLSNDAFRLALIEGTKVLRLVDAAGSVRHVVVISVPATSELVDFDDSFWLRVGSDTEELKGKKLILKNAQFASAQ